MKTRIAAFVLLLALLAVASAGVGAQTQPPNPDGETQTYPTYRGYWDGYLWFSWEPFGRSYQTAYIHAVVDGEIRQYDFELWDSVLPQLWWRVRRPMACRRINVYQGYIGMISIEGLPVVFEEGNQEGVDLFCSFVPIVYH